MKCEETGENKPSDGELNLDFNLLFTKILELSFGNDETEAEVFIIFVGGFSIDLEEPKEAADIDLSAKAFLALTRLLPFGIRAVEIGERKESVGLLYFLARDSIPSADVSSSTSLFLDLTVAVGLGVFKFGIEARKEDVFLELGGELNNDASFSSER